MSASDWKEKLAGRLVVASVSGGKDSAALSLWLTEQGIEHRRVFMDTGWEHDSTYEYLRGPLTAALGPIEEIRSERSMEEWIRYKGMFPSKQRRWCTELLKIRPMQLYLRALQDQGHEVVNCVGIRAAESESRSRLPEWEWSEDFDCEVWRPLIAWTEEDVIATHTRHGLRPNPLYLRGAARVGCWPCIYARKAEVRLMADIDPGRVERLATLERDVSEAQRARNLEKWRRLSIDTKVNIRGQIGGPRVRPAGWFQAPIGGDGKCWPIEDVVHWSRTSHGGRQVELFSPPERERGCMRWGLCDTAGKDDGEA